MQLKVILGIVYSVIAVLAFLGQAFFNGGDQSRTPWGLILGQSIGWPFILIRLIFRR